MVKPHSLFGDAVAVFGNAIAVFGNASAVFGDAIAVVAVLVAVAVVGACDKVTPPPAQSSEALFSAVMATQNKRLEAVHDVDVEGSIVGADGQTLRFRYAMQQPAFSSGELLGPDGARARAFIFDGKVLAVVDDGTKTISRRDLSGDEEQMLLTLHSVFSPFVCEGWRPPLLKAKGTSAEQHGDEVVLTTMVGQEGIKLAKVKLAKDGAFVSKETVADDGSVVASTTVVESVTDAASGLRFPKVWKMLEAGSSGTITLTSWKVNEGVDASRFSTATPAGFTERAQ